MYFKITQSGSEKYTKLGMVEVMAAFYLEKGDEGYDKYIAEHLINGRLNPFCNHSIQFEADATEEEILWCFEFALGITARNYIKDDLHCKVDGQVVNQDIGYPKRKYFYDKMDMAISTVKTMNPDLSAKEDVINAVIITEQIPDEHKAGASLLMSESMAKVASAKTKVLSLKETDFTTVSEIYSVK